jgi:hypothetical protein
MRRERAWLQGFVWGVMLALGMSGGMLVIRTAFGSSPIELREVSLRLMADYSVEPRAARALEIAPVDSAVISDTVSDMAREQPRVPAFELAVIPNTAVPTPFQSTAVAGQPTLGPSSRIRATELAAIEPSVTAIVPTITPGAATSSSPDIPLGSQRHDDPPASRGSQPTATRATLPAASTPIPPTSTPRIPINAPPPETTPIPPTSTPEPPTSTPEPPTSTPVPPTSTPEPKEDPPSKTPVPPTYTPVPPTSTPEPPTSTPAPPTDTPEPPTDTPEPPTDTPGRATDTPEPPADTPVQPQSTAGVLVGTPQPFSFEP